jgi:hypothetical protein
MQFSEGEGIAILAILLLQLLFVVAVLWLIGRWIGKLLPPSPPPPPHYVEDVSHAGKWVLLGVLLIMLVGLFC